MSYDKEKAIAAQNAATAAATLLSGTGADLDTFETTRDAIFRGTLDLAGIETIIETFEGSPSPAPVQQAQPTQVVSRQSYGGSDDHGAGVEVKFGKYRGQTIQSIFEQDPDYVDFLTGSNNDFIKKKAREFLAAQAA